MTAVLAEALPFPWRAALPKPVGGTAPLRFRLDQGMLRECFCRVATLPEENTYGQTDYTGEQIHGSAPEAGSSGDRRRFSCDQIGNPPEHGQHRDRVDGSFLRAARPGSVLPHAAVEGPQQAANRSFDDLLRHLGLLHGRTQRLLP